jgi:acyl-CoA reductase-like NAD-dependent aldehyde dehydrogenase
MRTRTLTGVLSVALLASLAPLTSGAAQHVNGSQSDRTPDLQHVQRQWSEASKALMKYSVAQRDEALARGKQLLNEMDTRLDALEAQTQRNWSELSHAAREQRREALRELRQQRNRVAEWYGGMEHGSAHTWEQVKRGFVTAYGELNSALGKAAKEFDRG